MSVTYNEGGANFYSTVTGGFYGSQQEGLDAEAAASGANLTGGTTAPASPSPEERQHMADMAAANDQTAKWDPKSGQWTFVPMKPNEVSTNQLSGAKQAANGRLTAAQGGTPNDPFAAPTDPNTAASDTVSQTLSQLGIGAKPAAPPALNTLAAPPGAPTFAPVAANNLAAPRARPTTNQFQRVTGQPADPNVPTGAPAPKLDTSASDKSVAGVNNTINQLLSLANTSPQTSAAEAQLMKSDQLAKLRSAQELEHSTAAALGAARSGNRRDQAILQRQAIGEGAYLGQESQRQAAVQQAETEGNLATLRATEEQTDFTNRANILTKAADLGLNVAALQVDVSKADLGSVNNYINDQFQQLGIDKQVSASEMGSILNFSQAMSAIKYDYDKMSDADQQHTLDLMMQQYGVDANTAVAMKQIQANHKGTLEKVFDGVLGLVGAAAPVVASVVTAGPKKPAAA